MAKKYFTCAETAKIMRGELKKAFPDIKFSVRSHVYAGGASINVNWTDGPAAGRVDQVVGQFAGATFDGMIDLKSYVDGEWDGQTVSWGADFVFTNREISPAKQAEGREYALANLSSETPYREGVPDYSQEVTGWRSNGKNYTGWLDGFIWVCAADLSQWQTVEEEVSA